ncbi:MAG: multicopper oxidase domain-containing protein, partial [Rhodothermales bacterium]|nr:multicopper oxidase domain-containing protein [Rhodothermales bacterium]
MPRMMRLSFAAVCVLLLSAGPGMAQSIDTHPEGALRVATPNDHRRSAGRMTDGVLRLDLEIVEAVWYPRGPEGPEIVTPAFAESGKAPSVPGPMIRVAVGTPVEVTVQNTLDRPVAVRGLSDRGTTKAERPEGAFEQDADFFFNDPLLIPPGESRHTRFTPTTEVTSFYYGRIEYREQAGDVNVPGGSGSEGALMGALVVDGDGGPPEHERLFVITRWGGREEPSTLSVTFKMMINGQSWPHTERLRYAVGDTVRWRILNASAIAHPMHLHGFYFRVDARGNTDSDSAY